MTVLCVRKEDGANQWRNWSCMLRGLNAQYTAVLTKKWRRGWKRESQQESWCASPEGSLSMSPSLCGLWHTPWISLYFNLSPVLWSTFFSACASICIFLHTECSTCLEIAESGLLEDQKKTERRKIEEHLINCEHVTSNSLLPWWAVATTASLSRE